ncbi:dihydropteridine reductase isoform X1 [Hydra vulgaris]|uniref:Dihydropteridine reductase n=1 Tax=Hydra vulgaris TaxID=6087 RepID=T2MH67_HYDVU|nr:dihydropteridine reductase [Hydra vulgaris]
MAATKRALVYGGKGALGSACVSALREKNYWVISVDLLENDAADKNVLVTEVTDWERQELEVKTKVGELLADQKLDGVFCVAGGWAGGNASSKDFIKNADMMWKQSVWSSTISASIASLHLKESGLLVLTGAVPALKGTGGMIGYGMAKAAVHQLTKSLAADGGLPDKSQVVAILPITLDTPMNRKYMPDADVTSWTPLEFVTDLFIDWLNGVNCPGSGSLVKLCTIGGKTETKLAE